jgi:hypothetical protein
MNIKSRVIHMNLRNIVRHVTDTPGNIEQVPHYTLSIQNRGARGVEWYGVFIQSIKPADRWTPEDTYFIKRCLCNFVRDLGGDRRLSLGVEKTAEQIIDVGLRRKPSALYAEGHPTLLKAYLTNGLELDVVRPGAQLGDVEGYGGFKIAIPVMGLVHEGLVYHRGLPLYNYLDVGHVPGIVREHLSLQFPLFFGGQRELCVTQDLVPRTRNQRMAVVAVRDQAAFASGPGLSTDQH